MFHKLRKLFRQSSSAFVSPVLQSESHESIASLNLGKEALEQGKLEDACAHLERAIAIEPLSIEPYRHLCFAHFQAGRVDAAVQVIENGIALHPNTADFHFCRGNLHHHANQLDAAKACYETARLLEPGQSSIHYNLGIVLKTLGETAEAKASFLRALDIDPTYVAALNGLGGCFQKLGDKRAALATFEKYLTVAPDQFHAHLNIGIVQRELGNIGKALTAFRTAAELDPKNQAVQVNLLHESLYLAEWDDFEVTAGTVLKNTRETLPALTDSCFPFVFLGLPDATNADNKIYAQRHAHTNFDGITQSRERLAFGKMHRLGDKIRVGYLSADFKNHPVSQLMARVFEKHDRNKFQFTAYSLSPSDGSALRQRVETAFDRFVDFKNLDSVAAATKIHEDQIDILVDLMGYTGGARPEILALRPAPIQVNYLGYPSTMGAKFMDYIIADNFIIPPELEDGYTEQVARLPHSYQPRDDTNPRPTAPNRATLGLPVNGFVFCCFNSTFKITPKIFGIWCELLDAVPDSVLWLLVNSAQTQNNLRREAAKRGVDPGRLIDAPKIPYADHLARIQCADLFLDTLPYNAHTTCSDALWMGLPVLTCAGETFASRVGGSLLTAMGVPELITYSLNDYKALALELARNREKLHALRNKVIANRNTSPLFDSAWFTRDLEAIYSSMVESYQNIRA